MLGADVAVAEALGVALGELERPPGRRGEAEVARGHVLAAAGEVDDPGPGAVGGDAQRAQRPDRDALLLAQQPEQQMLRADAVVTERPGLFLGEDDHPPGGLCEALEHGELATPRDPRGIRTTV